MSGSLAEKALTAKGSAAGDPSVTRAIAAGAPSFTYKIRESRDAWRLHRQLRTQSPLQAVDHKLKAAKFAASLGVAVPQILGGPAPLDQLLAPEAEEFSLKPLNGTSGKGVKLLRRRGTGFVDLVQGDFYASWKRALKAAADDAKYPSSFFTEELLTAPGTPPVPVDDFKFYCFYGHVGLVLQKHRADSRRSSYKWWSRTWEEVDTGRYQNRLDHDLPAPSRRDNLIATAEQLSKAVPVPFLRVDLYDAQKSVIFGEFTPHPGGYQTFSDEWDGILGALYEEAAARLQLDLTRGGFDLERFWEAFKGNRKAT